MNSNADLWYLWVAFDLTFFVLAVEIAITIGATRRQRRQRVVLKRGVGSTLTEHAGKRS